MSPTLTSEGEENIPSTWCLSNYPSQRLFTNATTVHDQQIHIQPINCPRQIETHGIWGSAGLDWTGLTGLGLGLGPNHSIHRSPPDRWEIHSKDTSLTYLRGCSCGLVCIPVCYQLLSHDLALLNNANCRGYRNRPNQTTSWVETGNEVKRFGSRPVSESGAANYSTRAFRGVLVALRMDDGSGLEEL